MDGKRSGDKEKTGPNTDTGNTCQQTTTKDIMGPRKHNSNVSTTETATA